LVFLLLYHHHHLLLFLALAVLIIDGIVHTLVLGAPTAVLADDAVV